MRKFHPPFCQKNGFRSSSPHPKNTCGFPSPAKPKTRSGFVFFSFTTHKVYEFHFPYPNTILLLFLSATRRLNLKYVSPPRPSIPNQKRFLSAPRLKIHICFVPLSFTTQNILSFPQPVCTKNMQISFPSALSTKNHLG